MAQLLTYLHFDGTCRQAMEFYRDCLGGELTLQTVGASPMAGQMPAEIHGQILHATLASEGIILMASDMLEGQAIRGNNVTLALVCSNKAEIERYFANLSAGANVTHPLKEEFFGTYGDLTDKFGIDWMFQLDNNPQ